MPSNKLPLWIKNSILLSLVTGISTLTVYDCEDPKTKFEAIDLTEPKPCPNPEKDFNPPQAMNVQIIQTDTTYPINAYQCTASISNKVTKCGFTSITYGQKWLTWREPKRLTPTECRELAITGKYKMGKHEWKVQMGIEHTQYFFLHGNVDTKGNCEVEDFEFKGIKYQGYYHEVFFTIKVQSIKGMADASSGWITFLNGLKAKVKDENLYDYHEGTLIWENREIKCDEQMSEIYRGESILYRFDAKDTQILRESIVMISDNATRQYAGLVLREAQDFCHSRCYGTQIPGVIVCPYRSEKDAPKKAKFMEYFNPMEIKIQTQLSFLHLKAQLQVRQRFEDIVADICILDRKILYTKLQAIAGANNQYALLDLYGPGHHLYTAGVVAYVAKCLPVQALRADYANCTHEIPILLDGQRKFADPLTFVIKPFPTIIACSDLMPVRWKLGGEWHCASPHARPCKAPTQLNVTVGLRQTSFDFIAGLDGGIYTKEQLHEHRLFQLSQTSREAVLSKITAAATEFDGEQGRLGLILGADDIRELSYHLSWHLAPFVWALGTIWHYLMGVGLLLMLLQFFIGTSIRAYSAYRIKGCGCWMLSAIWDTAFYFLTAPGRMLDATLKNITPPENPEVDIKVPLCEAKVYHEMVDELASYLLRYRLGLADVEKIKQEAEKITTKSITAKYDTSVSFGPDTDV